MEQARSVQLASITEENGRFVGTEKMHLFKSTFVPTPASVIADYAANEVVFDGYAAFVSTSPWILGLDAAGDAQAIYGGLASFGQTGVVTTDSAGGWYLTDTTSAILMLSGTFDAPIPFSANGTTLVVKPSYSYNVDAEADAEVVYGP